MAGIELLSEARCETAAFRLAPKAAVRRLDVDPLDLVFNAAAFRVSPPTPARPRHARWLPGT